MSKQRKNKRFAVGAGVLVGFGCKPGRVISVEDCPSAMGEYFHEVETEHGTSGHLGNELQLVPRAIANTESRSEARFGDVHFHGHNARLNVNSIDKSTNTVNETSAAIFRQIQEAAQSISDEARRAEVLARIQELESAHATSEFPDAYDRFIGTAADYITIFSGFLIPLAHMLAGKP